MRCDWFYPTRRRNRYLLGIKGNQRETDDVRYPLDAFVGCVDMKICVGEGDRQEFELVNNGQLSRFKSKSKEMTPTAVTERERVTLRQRQIDRENGTYFRF